MKLPFRMRINWMGGVRNWVWIDFCGFKYWYVFIGRKWKRPFLYRSIDATPPVCQSNKGDSKMIFGKYSG